MMEMPTIDMGRRRTSPAAENRQALSKRKTPRYAESTRRFYPRRAGASAPQGSGGCHGFGAPALLDHGGDVRAAGRR